MKWIVQNFKTNHISEKGINRFYFGLCPKIWVDFTLSISLYQMYKLVISEGRGGGIMC